jgi:hypothetical protein
VPAVNALLHTLATTESGPAGRATAVANVRAVLRVWTAHSPQGREPRAAEARQIDSALDVAQVGWEALYAGGVGCYLRRFFPARCAAC